VHLRICAAVERKGLDVRVSLAATQYESEINNIQAQPRTVFQRMRDKAADVAVPTHTGVAIVRLRRDVGSRHPRKPLYRMMGLEAGVAEPTLANVLPLPLSFVSKIEK